MRAVVQRVKSGKVDVEGRPVAKIGQGLVILLGVGPEDTRANAEALAKKIALMRIFEDSEEKMNLSVQDVKGGAIVVSQFTLYADTRKGNRPSFTGAAAPAIAEPLVDYFASLLRGEHNIPTQAGIFAADMLVGIENDGPVTIWLEM
jgi:D-tyrosyl-tRNA(Tyr) deacylase